MVGGIFMSRFKKKYIAVRVCYLNGKQVELQLPKDLKKPMWHYIHEHPHDWQQLLLGALINTPAGKYRNRKVPLMKVGKICAVFIKNKALPNRSRGQFITADKWQSPLINPWQAAFKQNVRFLQHDYPPLHKYLIAKDCLLWWFKTKWRP